MTKKRHLWSILICSINERSEKYSKLYDRLNRQIDRWNRKLSENTVEIVSFIDNRGENTIGHKRNWLVENAKGKYISFIDDDDWISDSYVESQAKLLRTNDYDCLELWGEITFNGRYPKKFTHSIRYDRYSQKDNVYYRPPNHLNCIRKKIAEKFPFPEKNIGEDTDWAMKICRSGLLKREKENTLTLYYYRYDTRDSVQHYR